MKSTRKVRNGEVQNAGKTTLCCPLSIRSRLSEQSKLLGWWRASHFLSPLSCCLSSFCWAVNRLPYIWTHSGIIFYPPSPQPRSPCQYHHMMASWAARAKGTYSMHRAVYFNGKPVTDRHTYIHTYTQAQPQTKAPLAPTMLGRLWVSRYGIQQWVTERYLLIFGYVYRKALPMFGIGACFRYMKLHCFACIPVFEGESKGRISIIAPPPPENLHLLADLVLTCSVTVHYVDCWLGSEFQISNNAYCHSYTCAFVFNTLSVFTSKHKASGDGFKF